MNLFKLLLITLYCFVLSNTIAQNKTTKNHSPARASVYSAVLPGLGQAYNFSKSKSYFTLAKIPIIYGLSGALTYFTLNNNKEYKSYRDAINTRQNNNNVIPDDDKFKTLDEDQLRRNKNHFRRQRDYNIIFIGIVYAANIIDANVDAHLMEFNVNESISAKFTPTLLPTYNYKTYTAGLSVNFRLNN